MPFGFTNAPSMVQSLINNIFCFAMRRYVLVFFDDISNFSKTWAKHMGHLKKVFHTLMTNQLHVNHSKCLIGQQQVEYLGYIISPLGISADPEKIKCMQTWPTPSTVTTLRGFLVRPCSFCPLNLGFDQFEQSSICNFNLAICLWMSRGGIMIPYSHLLTKIFELVTVKLSSIVRDNDEWNPKPIDEVLSYEVLHFGLCYNY